MSLDLTATWPNDWAELAGYDWYPSFNPLLGFPPPAFRDNFKRGEALPYYLDEYQLKYLRDRSRALCATNEFAICAIDNIRNYCVGVGFRYEAKAIKGQSPSEDLIQQVQDFIDLFCEANDLPEREAEASIRADVDGEWFIRLFPAPDDPGMTLIRFVEPELVKTMDGNAEPNESFGILTDLYDVETITGYSVIDDPLHKYTATTVPEADIVHHKINTRSTAKRGVPTMYPIETNLKRAEMLLGNMAAMAKIRAAVAMVRKYTGTPKATAQTLTDAGTEIKTTDPTSGQTISIERWRPATILNASKNIEYDFPNQGQGAAEFVQILQADLRACAARLNMPEWMFTADASNANYSSSFVSESACVKMFGQRQEGYARRWGKGRYGTKKSVIWRAIERAIEAGILPAAVKEQIQVTVECPSLLARDGDREASMNKVYMDMKVKSRCTIQKEIGLIPSLEDEEIKNDEIIKEQEAKQHEQAMSLKTATPMQGKEPIQTGDKKGRLQVARNYQQAEGLTVPDIRQTDEYSCGAVCSMAVARFYEVGPESLDEWKVMLGTEELGYTKPDAIIEQLGKLGLYAEASTMTLDELRESVREGRPVICPIQSEGAGHYVVVIGEALGNLMVHDPEKGSRLIPFSEWETNWHDEAEGVNYDHFGISVGDGDEMDRKTLAKFTEAVARMESTMAKLLEGRFPESSRGDPAVDHPDHMHIHLPDAVADSMSSAIAAGVAEGLKNRKPDNHTHQHTHNNTFNTPPIEMPEFPEIKMPEFPEIKMPEPKEVKIPPIVIPPQPAQPPAQVQHTIIPAVEKKPKRSIPRRDKGGKITHIDHEYE